MVIREQEMEKKKQMSNRIFPVFTKDNSDEITK